MTEEKHPLHYAILRCLPEHDSYEMKAHIDGVVYPVSNVFSIEGTDLVALRVDKSDTFHVVHSTKLHLELSEL